MCVIPHNSAFSSFNLCMFNEEDGTSIKNEKRKEFSYKNFSFKKTSAFLIRLFANKDLEHSFNQDGSLNLLTIEERDLYYIFQRFWTHLWCLHSRRAHKTCK